MYVCTVMVHCKCTINLVLILSDLTVVLVWGMDNNKECQNIFLCSKNNYFILVPYPGDLECFSESTTLGTFLLPVIGYLTLEIQSFGQFLKINSLAHNLYFESTLDLYFLAVLPTQPLKWTIISGSSPIELMIHSFILLEMSPYSLQCSQVLFLNENILYLYLYL